jgi:SAM-dependent MidA family methyltransferase
MEIALYHPEAGYYASAERRSGRGGDFYTSVDVGPVFGELLAEQFAEMGRLVLASSGVRRPVSDVASAVDMVRHAGTDSTDASDSGLRTPDSGHVDLVEAGAGNGRLSRDVLDALETAAPDIYARVRLHLVERSARARDGQPATLGRHVSKLASSAAVLPSAIHGIVFANELLDALPTHAVVGRRDGLREIFVDATSDRLVEREMAPSTPAIEEYFGSLGVHLLPGWRAEVNLSAVDWMRTAAGALQQGFLVLVDYGHEANLLYSLSHAHGTLATFTGHVVESRDEDRAASWLRDPGSSDITAHVDFTSVRHAARMEGLDSIGLVDQMHFLLGLGVENRLRDNAGTGRGDVMRRLALKALLVPGGLGTTHHVMIFGRNVGRPGLRGCAHRPAGGL